MIHNLKEILYSSLDWPAQLFRSSSATECVNAGSSRMVWHFWLYGVSPCCVNQLMDGYTMNSPDPLFSAPSLLLPPTKSSVLLTDSHGKKLAYKQITKLH